MTPFEASQAGAEKLLSLIDPGGRFRYRYNLRTGHTSKNYNLVRHAGALWSIVRVKLELLPADTEIISRGLNYLFKQMRMKDDLHIVDGGMIKLGADALTLLALVELIERKEYKQASGLDGIADELAHGLISMITPDNDFMHKVEFDTGKELPFRSEYYTGEALFALRRWCKLRNKSDNKIDRVLAARIAEGYGIPFQSHWMAYTVAEHMNATDPLVLEQLQDYAVKLLHKIITDLTYRGRKMSTPIACRTEALLALLPALPWDKREVALDEAVYNTMLQTKWTHSDGTVVQGDDRPDSVRIDYIQHNICGLHALDRQDGRPRLAEG